jgi:hypothetical protein
MSQLAFNEDGEPIDLPPTAAGWRVRRMKGTRGAPGLVYGSNGAPLVIPLEMDIEELRREVGMPGRYKLEPVDERRRQLEAEAAIVVVPPSEPGAEETAEAVPSCGPTPEAPSTMTVVMEAMRQNSEMARTIVDRFPAMLEASAVLLKAADGAGIPAREPRRNEDDQDDDDDEADEDDDGKAPVPTPASGFDLNGLIAQLVPVLITAISTGELKLPNLAEMLDWRRAVPKKPTEDAAAKPKTPPAPAAKPKPKAPAASAAKPQSSAEPADAAEAPADAATDAELPPLSPQTMAHFLAIQVALGPEEAALARAAAAELSPLDLRAWFDQLSAMSVPEAVERVRGLLAGTSKTETA